MFDDLVKRIFADRQLPNLAKLCIHAENLADGQDMRSLCERMVDGSAIEVSLSNWTEDEEARL
jgi:hypothetical protein